MERTSTLKIFSEYNLTLVVIGLGVLALATLGVLITLGGA